MYRRHLTDEKTRRIPSLPSSPVTARWNQNAPRKARLIFRRLLRAVDYQHFLLNFARFQLQPKLILQRVR